MKLSNLPPRLTLVIDIGYKDENIIFSIKATKPHKSQYIWMSIGSWLFENNHYDQKHILKLDCFWRWSVMERISDSIWFFLNLGKISRKSNEWNIRVFGVSESSICILLIIQLFGQYKLNHYGDDVTYLVILILLLIFFLLVI